MTAYLDTSSLVKLFVDEPGSDAVRGLRDGNAALAYDATMLLAAAIEAAGPSRARIRDWLASLAGSAPYPGVTGPIAFHQSGDVIGRGITMTRVRGGALAVERDVASR